LEVEQDMKRREFLKISGAAALTGVAGGAVLVHGLRDGVMIIGTGGAGIGVVRRLIEAGFDPRGFAVIDADAADLAGSCAVHQIQCGTKDGDGAWVITWEDRMQAEASIIALLKDASKVVLVAGLSGRMGAKWVFEIAAAGGLAEAHFAAQGLKVEVVTTLPMANEGMHRRYAARQLMQALRRHQVITHVAFNEDEWSSYGKAGFEKGLPDREHWLANQALRSALT